MGHRKTDVMVSAEPLLEYVKEHPRSVAGWTQIHPAAARRLHEARIRGELTFHMATDLCDLLGDHMSVIYGDLYWNIEIPDS